LQVNELEQRANDIRAFAKQEGDQQITDLVARQIDEVLVMH
jgi:hypothetical protein